MFVKDVEVLPLTEGGYPWAYMSLDGRLWHTKTKEFYWAKGTADENNGTRGFQLLSVSGGLHFYAVKDAVALAWYHEPEYKWKGSPYEEAITRYKEFHELARNGDLRYLCHGSVQQRICYYVSRYGDMWSDKNCYKHKPQEKEDGYLEVKVNKRSMKLHRLIAQRWCKIPQELIDRGFTINTLQVNHIDGNTHNNRADNLEWVTAEENCHDSWRRNPVRRDNKRYYSNELLENICKDFARNLSQKEIAEKYNVSRGYLDTVRYLPDRPRFIKLLKKYRWTDKFRYKGKVYHIDDEIVFSPIQGATEIPYEDE